MKKIGKIFLALLIIMQIFIPYTPLLVYAAEVETTVNNENDLDAQLKNGA